jgi:GxxExxY protein
MHPLFVKADELSHKVIGAAIEVHREKGPGLLESIYERCLMHELWLRKLSAINQKLVRVTYKDLTFEEPLDSMFSSENACWSKRKPSSGCFLFTRPNC